MSSISLSCVPAAQALRSRTWSQSRGNPQPFVGHQMLTFSAGFLCTGLSECPQEG